MSTVSLSVESAKHRLLASNYTTVYEISHICEYFVWNFQLYEIFICMTFSSVWLFHLYDSVWLFHLYDFFTCMTFSPVWLFHLYDFFICITFSSVWLFHLYDFFICMTFSSVWDFHLWVLSVIIAKYASEAFFWWNDHHTNIFLRCEACFHHYITSSHVFFKFDVVVIFTSLSSFFNKKTKFSKRTSFS